MESLKVSIHSICSTLIMTVVWALGSAFTDEAFGTEYPPQTLTHGVSNCSIVHEPYIPNTPAFSHVTMTIHWDDMPEVMLAKGLPSRGLSIYKYADGTNLPGDVTYNLAAPFLDGVKQNSRLAVGNDHIIYYSDSRNGGSWIYQRARDTLLTMKLARGVPGTNFVIIVKPVVIDNYDRVEDLGGYLLAGSGKNCIFVDPMNPPPVPPDEIDIVMNAPDWNLGELKKEDNEVTFNALSKQLCFTYSSVETGIPFNINAVSSNISTGNTYNLVNLNGHGDVIPYTLTLENFKENIVQVLPSNALSKVRLSSGGMSCFTPTFKVKASESTPGGIYTDSLTFDIVTPA